MKKREFTNKWISGRLGALPSAWDPRSINYMKTLAAPVDLPEEYVELLQYCPSNFKFNQGNIGSCVGWDFSGVIEVQATLFDLHTPGTLLAAALMDLSAGWAYHFSRKHSVPPVPDWQEGSTNFGACKALHKVGVALEADVPTDTVAPWDGIEYTAEHEKRAMENAITSYHKVPSDPTSVKSAIYGVLHELPYKMPDGSDGKSPLAAAYPVYANFKESYDDGIVPMPTGNLLGGHSSMIVGWKVIDGQEYFINYNSWGKDVGDDGIFYIPVEYPFYPNDWWLLKIIGTTEPPKPTCIWETPGAWTGFLNMFKSGDEKYFHGRKAA